MNAFTDDGTLALPLTVAELVFEGGSYRVVIRESPVVQNRLGVSVERQIRSDEWVVVEPHLAEGLVSAALVGVLRAYAATYQWREVPVGQREYVLGLLDTARVRGRDLMAHGREQSEFVKLVSQRVDAISAAIAALK